MNSQNITERRLQTHKLAQELLDKRQQLWALREQLVTLQPYAAELALEPLVRRFCQELIDYISLEHFGVFHHLLNGQEQDRHVVELAEDIYPRMAATTDAALDFNDKCEAYSAADLRRELPGELALLGDELALRVAMEDRLIEGMTA
ncbi:MAG: Rsd/AlgQ family anti-sigma factor [Candidatus Methylumidiphilus sp.]